MSYATDQAISLGNQITENLSSSMIDNYGNGNYKVADQQAIDCCLVRSLVKVLEFYNTNGVDTELTTTQINSVIFKIHEYESSLLLELEDFTAQAITDPNALSGTTINHIVYQNTDGSTITVPTPHVYSFVVGSDGQTVFIMPFNVASIDTDSLYLTLNSASNPIYGTDYTMAGTALTWTGEYPLSTGWEFELKYSI